MKLSFIEFYILYKIFTKFLKLSSKWEHFSNTIWRQVGIRLDLKVRVKLRTKYNS